MESKNTKIETVNIFEIFRDENFSVIMSQSMEKIGNIVLDQWILDYLIEYKGILFEGKYLAEILKDIDSQYPDILIPADLVLLSVKHTTLQFDAKISNNQL